MLAGSTLIRETLAIKELKWKPLKEA